MASRKKQHLKLSDVMFYHLPSAKQIGYPFFLEISDSYLLLCPRYSRKSSCAHLIFSLVIYKIDQSRILWEFVCVNDLLSGIWWEREGQ